MINWGKYSIKIDEEARLQFEQYFNDIARILDQQQLAYKKNEVFDELKSFIIDYITNNKLISISYNDSLNIIKELGLPEEYKDFSTLPGIIANIHEKTSNINKILCPKCNTKNNQDAIFCDNCGTNLKKKDQGKIFNKTAIEYIFHVSPVYFLSMISLYFILFISILSPYYYNRFPSILSPFYYNNIAIFSPFYPNVVSFFNPLPGVPERISLFQFLSNLGNLESLNNVFYYLIFNYFYLFGIILVLLAIYEINKQNSTKYIFIIYLFAFAPWFVSYASSGIYLFIHSNILTNTIIYITIIILQILLTKLLFFSSYSKSFYSYSTLKINKFEKYISSGILSILLVEMLIFHNLLTIIELCLLFLIFSIVILLIKYPKINKLENKKEYTKLILQKAPAYYKGFLSLKNIKLITIFEFIFYALTVLFIESSMYYVASYSSRNYFTHSNIISSFFVMFLSLLSVLLYFSLKENIFNDLLSFSLSITFFSTSIVLIWQNYYPSNYQSWFNDPIIFLLFSLIFFLIVPIGTSYLLLSHKGLRFNVMSSKSKNIVFIILYILNLMIIINLISNYDYFFYLNDILVYYSLASVILIAKPFYDFINYFFSFNKPNVLAIGSFDTIKTTKLKSNY